MSLELAVLSMWIIASMLACWCFSLIVRMVTEWIARKRKRLAARYTRKSLVLAFVLMGVCALGAVFGAGSAYSLSTGPGLNGTITPLGAIGGGVLLFACFLVIWASVGDRSRGRPRCPRCWYDMRDSQGMPCPECGCEIKDEHHLLRTRRPLWAFVLAAVFIVVGGTGVLMNQRYRDQGLAGFIPDFMLLRIWESAPASWIYGINGDWEGTLRYRIESGQISTDSRRRLVGEILDQMTRTRAMRWNPKALNLLEGALDRENYGEGLEVGEPIWLPNDKRLERAYGAALGDLAAMLANGPRDSVDDSMLDINRYDADIIQIGRRWLLSHEFGRPAGNYSYELTWNELLPSYAERIPVYLDGSIPPINEINELELFRADGDTTMQDRLRQLLADTGLLSSRIEPYLDAVESSQVPYARAFYITLGSGLATLPPDRRAGVYARLETWLRSDELQLRIAAIKVMEQCGLMLNESSSPRIAEFARLIETAIEQCMDDKRLISGFRFDRTVSASLGKAVVQIDTTGIYAFPCVRYALRINQNNSASSWYNEQTFTWDDECIARWVEIFEPMSTDERADVREWVALHTPERTGSPSDARLEEMLQRLVKDMDENVQDSAIHAIEARRGYKQDQQP